MFESKYVYKYLGAIAVLGFASYYGNQIKQKMSNKDENDELIRKYLLNESPLYGMNRPKLWIHSKYEINARSWKNFQSRNTTDLNQPYLHQTIKSIINHCGDDFNVCLIDDETFSKLIPDWDVNLATLSEPFRSNFREVGMLQLLYIYGGVVLPNSFICMKNVAPIYKEMITQSRPFFAEEINRTAGGANTGSFVPGMQIMGAQKACPILKEIIVELQKRNKSNHFSNEPKFTGQTSQLLQSKKITIIDGRLVGVKTKKGKSILLDDLMSEDYLDLDPDAYGVIVPADEVLSRSKYQWLAYLSINELMKTKMVLTKYLKASIVDSSNEYFKSSHLEKSVTSI